MTAAPRSDWPTAGVLSHPLRRVLLALAVTLVLAANASSAPTLAADPMPACTYSDVPARYAKVGDWYRSIVDTRFRIAATYAPSDLVPASRSGAPATGSVRALVLPDLTAMYRAARAAGAPFAITSAYRSYSYQVGTFHRWVQHSGVAAAKLASARPGHSEHQLGTSMDLTSPAHVSGGRVSGVGKGPWEYADWGRTAPGAWLARNSWKYGFVMSYPKVGSPGKTCYKYEPWHFRYVGRALAAAIHRSALTPREWLWQHGAGTTWSGGSPGTGSTQSDPGAAPPADDVTISPDAPSTDTEAFIMAPAPAPSWPPLAAGVVTFLAMLEELRRRGRRLRATGRSA
jgi:D-alanyl-D-alanine carboxypeptidase